MMRVSVIIPTLNEEGYIGALLKAILEESNSGLLEIIVADGGSSDRTRTIVETMRRHDERIRFLENPARIQAAGVNLAALASDPTSEVLIRLDAHAEYPKQYISRLLEDLDRTGADSIVVRLRSVGRSCFQKAVAAASNSQLGTGGAAHRVGGKSGWIDHGHHAAFRRERFISLGGYNEDLSANEDAEYDARQRKSGARIWFDADLEIIYFPRSTPSGLVKQYSRYGVGRAQTLWNTRERPRLRQLAAPFLVAILAVCVLASPFSLVLISVPLTYVFACALFGFGLFLRTRDACVAVSGLAAVLMHLSWGIGFWRGVITRRSSGMSTSLCTQELVR